MNRLWNSICWSPVIWLNTAVSAQFLPSFSKQLASLNNFIKFAILVYSSKWRHGLTWPHYFSRYVPALHLLLNYFGCTCWFCVICLGEDTYAFLVLCCCFCVSIVLFIAATWFNQLSVHDTLNLILDYNLIILLQGFKSLHWLSLIEFLKRLKFWFIHLSLLLKHSNQRSFISNTASTWISYQTTRVSIIINNIHFPVH